MLKFFAQSGYLLAFLATIIWSGNFIVARGLNETYSAITIAFFRWGIAAIVITPLAYRAIKRDLHLLRKQWKLVLMLAIIGVSIFNTLIYQAAHSTPALNLSLIAITAPLYVVILNRIVFKEFLTKRQISGLIILFFGLLLLLSNGDLSALLSLSFNIGDLLMAMAASLFGVYSVLAGKKLMGNLSL
ncbi:MAG: DMT family transporter [Flammeovirgaceae bacterium]|nr:DMT family transporter [Flammeovirgaceae bacterium]